MAEKRRYWLKLEKDFLKSKQIKVIKAMPNGDKYILFYLALMLESIEHVGHLRFNDLVAYNENMLSAITDTDIDTVRSAMSIFRQIGLIQVLEDSTIFLPDIPKMTGQESASAERVRTYRANQQALQCNIDVTKCNSIKEKEKNEQITDNIEDKKINFSSFEKFYNLYPSHRKSQKDVRSMNLFSEMIASGKVESAEWLINRLKEYINSSQWENPKYIPNMQKWLEDKCLISPLETEEPVSEIMKEVFSKEEWAVNNGWSTSDIVFKDFSEAYKQGLTKDEYYASQRAKGDEI